MIENDGDHRRAEQAPGCGDDRRRPHDRRLHRLGPAATRARQLHLRRDGLGDLQRASAPHRPLDPVESRLLPAGAHHRPAGDDRERRVPGCERRRELGDSPAPRNGDLRSARVRLCPSAYLRTTAALPHSWQSVASIRKPARCSRISRTRAAAGAGGRTKDGNNALCIPNGNCALQPIEILETRYPMLHEALAIEEGSAGAGRNRGGFGYRRQFRVMSEELRVSCFIEKEEIRPWGLFGGEPGKNSGILVSQDGGETFRTMTEAFGVKCNGKFSDVYLAKGDSLRIITSGGGGYGPALERSFDRIEEDVRQGFIPREQAESEYVVRFRADSVEIDVPATEALRRDGSAHRAAALSGELEKAP